MTDTRNTDTPAVRAEKNDGADKAAARFVIPTLGRRSRKTAGASSAETAAESVRSPASDRTAPKPGAAAAASPSFTSSASSGGVSSENTGAEAKTGGAGLSPTLAGSTRRQSTAAEHEKALSDKILLSRLASERSGDAERLSAIPDATSENPAPWLTRRGEAAGLPSLGVTGAPPPIAKTDASDSETDAAPRRSASEAPPRKSPASPKTEPKPEVPDAAPDPSSAAPAPRKTREGGSPSPARRAKKAARAVPSAVAAMVNSADTGLPPAEPAPAEPAEQPAAASEEAPSADAPAASYEERGEDGLYPVVKLTGRRSRLAASEEPEATPAPVVNLEDERNVDIMLARTSVQAIAARQQARRRDIEARLAKEAMARQAEARAGMSEKALREAECERQLHLNTLRQAAEEHAAMMRREPVPIPENVSAVLDDPAAAADYARRMHAWESALIAEEDERRRLDAPRRRHPIPPREPLPGGTDSTLGGFPSPEPLRRWTAEGGSGRPGRPTIRRLLSALTPAELIRRWSGLDRLLQAGLAVLGIAALSTWASWLTARVVVPELALMSTPIAVTAVVADDELRDLMMLAGLLEARGMPSGRTAPLIGRAYLTPALREKLGDGSDEARLSLPLSDELLRAALLECADETGAPVVSRRMVLALPAASSAQGAAVDVTARVAERLGLAGISAAAARRAVEAALEPGAAAPDLRLSPVPAADLFRESRP